MRAILLLALVALLAAADSWDRLAEASRKPPAEARAALEKLLLEEPGFAAARFNLGTLLLDGDPAKAAEQLELATADGGAIAGDAWHNLALARFRQGRLEEALLAAERAVQLDPQAAALRDEIRRIALARQDEARRKAEEEAKKLHLAPVPLPPARVGQAYDARLPIAGGQPPATVALAGSSRLPDGLSLAGDGHITGTPRSAGTSKLDLALQDRAGAKATAATELRVLPVPAITTAVLPEAILGQPYQARLAAIGFEGPQQWSIAALPAGLSGSADGVISGTPSAAGTATVHLHVGDGTLSADRLLDLVVSDGFAPAEDPLPPATATAAYQHRVTVRGPAQEYRWSAAPDAPLRLAADGTLSGTPAQAGELKLPARIAAADGRSREVSLTLPVNPLPLIQPEPVQLQVGTPVDQPLKVEGGTPPYAWSAAGGSLPAGIHLDPDGHLRGVAKDPGGSTVTVALADRWKADTRAELKITVAPASDPPPKDPKQDQAKQDQQKQDGKPDQQKPDGKLDQAKQDQQKQDQAKPDGKLDQQPSAGQERKADDPAEQAAVLNQTAADRWLDQLPPEQRNVLRYQLLDGGNKKPAQHGKTW